MSNPKRLDLGCGPSRAPSYFGVDIHPFDGVDMVLNLVAKAGGVPDYFKPWPWEDNSIEEAYSSHFVEHLDPTERIHFFNEVHRILEPGARAYIITPHWCSQRAYGDPTHKWPPLAEFSLNYLRKSWRMKNAPHTDAQYWPQGYTCDFETTYTYETNPHFPIHDTMAQDFARKWYKEVINDLRSVLHKR